jgi:hypothetical protein
MSQNAADLEKFWDGILSEDKAAVLSAFLSVPLAEQQQCLAHLREIVTGADWQPAQRRSAEFALKVLE